MRIPSYDLVRPSIVRFYWPSVWFITWFNYDLPVSVKDFKKFVWLNHKCDSYTNVNGEETHTRSKRKFVFPKRIFHNPLHSTNTASIRKRYFALNTSTSCATETWYKRFHPELFIKGHVTYVYQTDVTLLIPNCCNLFCSVFS